METKAFQISPECKNLTLLFWDLKQNACEELKENGIDKEPAQAELSDLQNICSKNSDGPLANYVRELKKCFRMNEEELFEYNNKVSAPQKTLPPSDSLDSEDSVMSEVSDNFDDLMDFGDSEDSEVSDGFGDAEMDFGAADDFDL